MTSISTDLKIMRLIKAEKLALWRCGAVALWRCGAVALWRCGAVALRLDQVIGKGRT
jgi:hypothetical protein